MNTREPQNCRQQMSRLLDEEIAAIWFLEQALAGELTAITDRDTAAIEQSVAVKLQGLEKMEALNRQRLALVESFGFQPDKAGMQACLDWCDQGGILQRQWQQLLSAADSCRHNNLINHHMVELGSRHMHQALCILRGEDPENTTYDTLGNTGDNHNRRTLARV